MPVRIQRKRTKGWKMPEGAVSCTRPSRYGNPFKIGRWYAKGNVFANDNPPRPHRKYIFGEIQIGNRKPSRVYTCSETKPKSSRFHLITNAAESVQWYRWYLSAINVSHRIEQELRGRNLMCFCHLCEKHKDGKPSHETCGECDACHVDVLLEIANTEGMRK